MNMILALIMAFASGGTVVISRMFNGRLAVAKGETYATRMNYATGLVVSAVITGVGMLVFKTEVQTEVFDLQTVVCDWWMLLGGAIGAGAVAIAAIAAPRMSAADMTLISFAGQMAAGLLIDGLQTGAWDRGHIIGTICILAALYLRRTPVMKKA